MIVRRYLYLLTLICSAALVATGCSEVDVNPNQETQTGGGCCCKNGSTACCGDAGSGGTGGGALTDGGTAADVSDTCICPEGYEVSPDGQSCVNTISVGADQLGTTWQVCRGEDSNEYSKRGTVYNGRPLSDNVPSDHKHRLRDVGVWTCTPDGSGPWFTTNQGYCNPGGQACSNNSDCPSGSYCETTSWLPIHEWIGFSVCLDVEESGDYLIGMGADNAIRFYVNGQLEFAREWDHYNNNTMNHKNWFVEKISLQAGPNFIRLEGWNDANIAGFGAEISGPFPPGSLTDQSSMRSVDYEDNLIFSTKDLIGEEVHTFDTGQSSGFQCPDGYSLNTCGPEPICTKVVRVPCGVEEGACCESGSCTQTTEQDCGGEFLGWGLACNDPTVVEQCLGSGGADAGSTDTGGTEIGACCVRRSDGSECVETTESRCREQEGHYFGPGTDCSAPAVQEKCGAAPDTGVTDTGPTDTRAFDLEINKVFGGTVTPRQGGEFEITVRNNGPDSAPSPIVVEDTIPDCLQVDSVSGSNWNCSGSQPTQCTYSGSALNSGASTSFTVKLAVADPDLCSRGIRNCAEIASPGDVDSTNDRDCDSTEFSQ